MIIHLKTIAAYGPHRCQTAVFFFPIKEITIILPFYLLGNQWTLSKQQLQKKRQIFPPARIHLS